MGTARGETSLMGELRRRALCEPRWEFFCNGCREWRPALVPEGYLPRMYLCIGCRVNTPAVETQLRRLPSKWRHESGDSSPGR